MQETDGTVVKSAWKFRIPLRYQITFLLAFFVLGVAYVSFQSAFSFLEEDKLGAIREVQTLKVADLARDLNERAQRVRQELRESGIRLLDPERGPVQLDLSTWSWVRVRDKVWKSTRNKEAVPDKLDPLFQFSPDKPYFKAWINPNNKDRLIVQEPLSIEEGGKRVVLMIVGEIDKRVFVGDPSRMTVGPIRGVIVEASEFANKVPRNEQDVQNSIWGGVDAASRGFSSLLLTVPEIRGSLAKPSQPSSRVFFDPNSQNRLLVSWATVPLQQSEMNLAAVSFVNQTEILRAFFRKKVELGFWVFLVMGFGIMAASFLGSRLSRPIESMVGAAKVLEKGDFSVRVKQDRSDELGDLAAAFNHMGESLEQRDRELQAANAALIQNEKLAALGTLSAGLAHEVKNPLAGILGHADMTAQALKKMDVPNRSQLMRHIETIQKETKRCKGIIDNLMRFSRNDGAKTITEFEPMDIELCAWDAIALTEHPLNLAKVKIEKEFSPDAQMINGNANQVEQVLLNMMQNAGHAMPQGGTLRVGTNYYSDSESAPIGKLRALQHPEFKGPFVRIYVSDSGQGMSEEVQRKIFEPFFTTKAKGVGTGLGLAVTMQILTDHKARVSLTSAPGEGTTFYLDFMARKPRSQAVLEQLEEIRHHRKGGASLSTDVNVAAVGERLLAESAGAAHSEVSLSGLESSGRATPSSSASSPMKAPIRPNFAKRGNPVAAESKTQLTASVTKDVSLQAMDIANQVDDSQNPLRILSTSLESFEEGKGEATQLSQSGLRPPPPTLKTTTSTVNTAKFSVRKPVVKKS